MFLLYYFLFLDKTYNKQNQERFIICQRQPLEVFRRKSVFKNLENFTKITHLCWCLFLLKLHAFRHVVQKMLCFSFCWVFLYQQNRFVIFSLISYPSIESVAKSLTCFFFLSYFNKLFAPNIWKVLT